MNLQVRLRHPLGDRLIELSPRGVQQPVVVGRAAGAEVQVPSVAVLPKHCLLFVHRGRLGGAGRRGRQYVRERRTGAGGDVPPRGRRRRGSAPMPRPRRSRSTPTAPPRTLRLCDRRRGRAHPRRYPRQRRPPRARGVCASGWEPTSGRRTTRDPGTAPAVPAATARPAQRASAKGHPAATRRLGGPAAGAARPRGPHGQAGGRGHARGGGMERPGVGGSRPRRLDGAQDASSGPSYRRRQRQKSSGGLVAAFFVLLVLGGGAYALLSLL